MGDAFSVPFLPCLLSLSYLSNKVWSVIYQLMNEAEYLMKNYGDQGGCYPSRPKQLNLVPKSSGLTVH